MRALLGVAMILVAAPLGLIVFYIVAVEVASDDPQYASFYAIEHVRGWLAAAILGVPAAVFLVGGVRLLRRARK